MLSPLITPILEERHRWFYWLPVVMGAGIGGYFALPEEPALAWLSLTPLLMALCWLTRAHPWLQILVIMGLTLALGFNAAQLESRLTQTIMLDHELGPISIEGRIMMAEPLPDGTRLLLDQVRIGRLPAERTPQQIRLKVKQAFAEIPDAGTWLDLYGAVGPPSAPVAPGAFDFRRQAYFQKIGGIGWTYGELKIAVNQPPPSLMDGIKLAFEAARRDLAMRVAAQLTGDAAAMVSTLLTGSQTGIAKDIMQDMRASGLAHLLSISGIHVSMIGLLVYWPVRQLLAMIPFLALRFPIKKWAAGVAILGTFSYTLLVGLQTPTLRSALMTMVLMMAIMLDRRVLSMRLVALSALVVMLVFPSGMLGPSFQMSFAAVLAMVAFYEKPLDAALRQSEAFSLPVWLDFVRKHAGSIVITSLVATAATAPFSLYHFQSFSFYGVIANMLAIPLTSFWIMPCLLLTYFLAPFGLEAWPLQAAGWGVELLIQLASHVADWPFATLHFPAMPFAAFITVVLGGLWLCLWQRHWRYLGLVPILLGMLYPFYTKVPDVLIDENAAQWAVRLPDGSYAVKDPDKEKFTLTQWQQRLGFPDMVAAEALEPDNAALRCDPMGCVYQRLETRLALPATNLALAEDCLIADIVVTAVMVKDCPASLVIDKKSLRAKGAQSLTSDGQLFDIASVRDRPGQRPWSSDASLIKP